MQGLKGMLGNGKWKQMKKSDWAVLALFGVLLLVVTLPSGGKGKSAAAQADKDSKKSVQETDASVGREAGEDAYTARLEDKLAAVLSKMEGVGKVRVMITVADSGEHVVEKDSSGMSKTTEETDSGGGSRSVTECENGEETVYVDTGSETYPYIQKEKVPAVEGIVVVAEGGGNAKIVSEITEAVRALFPVEAHRVKVLKMAGSTQSSDPTGKAR